MFKSSLERIKNQIHKLEKEVMALYLASKRKDVPWNVKIVLALVVGYALSPIDLIPDFIPVLGYLDDIIIVPLGISLAIKLVPKEILDECRVQAEEAFNTGKPKNWIAGVTIILIWLLLAIWMISKIL